ncbi:MAG TPA: type II toxin-antitoxin system RelE/ParE family toxin [Solirubrobacteraceae bacterium]|jgi:mRNA interferase RelE/StbE|nr:type II toxin-antitoxin system RelE/ParE family toxin [Solirubrobacteraceae bacterium]
MSDPSWSLVVTRPAGRDLRRLDPPVRRRVGQALEGLLVDEQRGDVRPLVGRPEWRLRVGDWRVFYLRDTTSRIVTVTRVLPRGRAYDR